MSIVVIILLNSHVTLTDYKSSALPYPPPIHQNGNMRWSEVIGRGNVSKLRGTREEQGGMGKPLTPQRNPSLEHRSTSHSYLELRPKGAKDDGFDSGIWFL